MPTYLVHLNKQIFAAGPAPRRTQNVYVDTGESTVFTLGMHISIPVFGGTYCEYIITKVDLVLQPTEQDRFSIEKYLLKAEAVEEVK